MKNKKLVSILISAYNHEKYIEETIYSIINQDYRNIELLIIDDGSQDKTWDIIQSLKEKCIKRFTRIYFHKQINAGFCVTLNYLLDRANGEYIS